MTDEKQNTVPENPEEKPKREVKHEINSISDLIEILGNKEAENEETKQKKIKGLGKPEPGKTRFFRGHANEGWQMLPSIYRAKHLIENEDKIIKDALTYCPDDFLPSDTLFEKLVKLQHYGYSTRLLDLTTNALVALYFSSLPYINPETNKEEKKDGEFIILDIPNADIKYNDSDTVTVLSAISLQNAPLDINEIIEITNSAKEILENNINYKDYDFTKGKPLEEIIKLLRYFKGKILKGTKEYLDYQTEKYIRDFYLEFFNQDPVVSSLLHTIQMDKPSFRPLINPDDLQRVLCVRAKLNNARISRQQGCFLIFGIKDNKTEAAAIPDKWQRFASNRQKILVKAETKAAIMQELQSFGISKRTLFPELEAQATEIMNHYKNQK